MENKYFVPEISDFCIGYELEHLSITDFIPTKVEIDSSLPALQELIKLNQVRVPYITKEQIEAEGWTYYQNIPDMVVPQGYIEYYKDVEWFKVVISISETSHYLDVQKVFQNVQIGNELQEFRNTIYNGECKDINTFRKIIKLLGI